MNPENNNLLNRDSLNQQEKNISRLMRLTGDLDKPNRIFTESLINNALGRLERFKSANIQDENFFVKKYFYAINKSYILKVLTFQLPSVLK